MNKVNIFHEWLDTSGGAESVLAELLGIYPDATVYTLWAEPKLIKSLGVEVKVSLLQFLPPKSRRSLGLLFMPLAWKILGRNISSGDFSITSSWVFCHSAVPKKFEKNSVHYIHTPARYWWNPEVDTRTELKVPRIILLILRAIDKLLARNHKNVIANSNATSERIKNYWGLKSTVIHPPVDVEFYNFSKVEKIGSRENFLLCVGRFVPYKGHELAIKLGEALSLPVVLVGHGSGETRLRKLSLNSKTPVSILVNVPREKIRELYATCTCLVYPAIEDFGIVPVEAMATGARVLGINHGGLRDSVIQGETGSLVSRLDLHALVEGFYSLQENSRENIRATSLRFSQDNFSSKIKAYIENIKSI